METIQDVWVTLFNSIYKVNSILVSSQTKALQKIYYRMSYYHKCINLQQNTSNTVFQQYIKNRTHYGQVVFKMGQEGEFYLLIEGWLLLKKHQCNSANKVKKKSHAHLNSCRKSIWLIQLVLMTKVLSKSEVIGKWKVKVMSGSLSPPWTLYSPWNSPGQNTGVSSLSFLQRIFPTQGWNPGLLHCRRILHQLSHKESPK